MRCPFCGASDSRVTDSRATEDGIRRRRHCVSCGERFSTIESVQRATVVIVKKDGRREYFDRQKLATGLRKACEKRQISVGQIEELVTEIEGRVAADTRPEVPSSLVGELTMDALRRLDHIAYIRFASVYRAFSDMESLKEAIAAVEEGRVPSVDEQTLQLPLIGEGQRPPDPKGAGTEEEPPKGPARSTPAREATG